ncbi:hypothetical protein SAMN05216227_1007115 [Pseudorhodobacter antarcticus]|uniref:Tetratricopeptide repeat-like domain-containing protein n=1 Tax=Pseudorhodobacter antarcticus TaxID=1077947 RepID=A0A1H8DSI0_9RHOB|nr:hypothetical protein [Pseudorhodobacter antarcticus]SEN10125.1 hypothetical protein SAMN05216227_1007115 [Pseudorhodobacter antarcticus]
MSNPDSFIDEVTEEVRRDRLFMLFRKYGWIALLLVVVIVGGAAYSEWQKANRATAAKAFGDTLLTALDQPTPAERRTALAAAESAANGVPSKLALQKMLVASDPAGDKAATLAALAAVAADTTIDQNYRDLAVLRGVIVAGADQDVATRRAALEPLTIPGRPFRTLALEQLAYLLVEAGDIDAAITQLRALSADQEAPTGLRGRAGQMITALGGQTAEG